MTIDARHPCPCCGHLVFDDGPGSDEICPICKWQDDLSQLRFPDMPGGGNRPSLIEAQRNFATFGASDARFSGRVRAALPEETKDPTWRPVDLASDRIERPVRGIDYGLIYPEDLTCLYYWRIGCRREG